MSEQRKGRHLVRVSINGERRRVGSCDSEEEADALRAEVYARAGDAAGVTLEAFGAAWLDRRETVDGVRGIRTERSRWRTHLEGTPLAAMALVMITPADVEAWLDVLQKKLTATPYRTPRPISPKMIKEVVGLLKMVFDDATPQHITVNPVAALKKRISKATKKRGVAATVETWTYLEPDEQDRIRFSEAIPEVDRLIILFALLTGLRQGEQFNLELPDVHVDDASPHVVVRFGSKGEAPKNGKIRRVYLSADGVDVCRRWLALLPSYAPRNPKRLMFPGPAGSRMSTGKTPLVRSVRVGRKVQKVDHFKRHLRACGITRPFHWHCLRHSTASSYVAGWWGRRWTLPEVQEALGHTSLQSTQRYVHLGDTAIKGAVAATPGWAPALPTLPQIPPELSALTLRNRSVGRQGLEPWTYGLKALIDPLSFPEDSTESGREGGRDRAVAALKAVAAGEPVGVDLLVRVAEEVAAGAAPPAPSARSVLLAQLGEGLQRAASAGDDAAARVAHEAIGRLLALPAAEGAQAPVVDLALARGRRGA